jgi:hypothetical protein
VIYTILSLLILVPVIYSLSPRFSKESLQRYRVLLLGLACFIAPLGFFALMSIIYDFNECPYPSRAYPYFTSGRLMLGMLIPFLLLVAYGLDRVLARFKNTTKFTVLAVLVSTMLAVEIITDWPVFSNPYNWFHLP